MAEPESSAPSILFIDDDADVRRAAALLLERRGFTVLGAPNPAESWAVLAAQPVDVVLLDLNFARGATTGEEGLTHLRAMLAHEPERVVVVVTGHSGIAIAVAAMRAGAADFVMKPWHNDRLVQTLRQAAALAQQRRAARPPDAGAIQPVLGQSAAMLRLIGLLQRAAPTAAPMLLAGERGTGKTLLAQTIHRLSGVAAGPLITADAAADPAELVQAARAASTGTLVLDGPGGLPSGLQKQLLQVLNAHPGARLVSCTVHAPPDHGMEPELLAQLGVVTLLVPGLAARAGDVELLARHFSSQFALRYGRLGLALSPDAAAFLSARRWPGQVRSLRHAIERAVVLAEGPLIEPSDFALEPAADAAPDEAVSAPTLAQSERAAVEAALRRHGFNVSHAARALGITRATLYRRMARYGL